MRRRKYAGALNPCPGRGQPDWLRWQEAARRSCLTNLYNQRPTWLANAHATLDAAVLAAYGWPVHLTDAEILERLLALNLDRAAEREDETARSAELPEAGQARAVRPRPGPDIHQRLDARVGVLDRRALVVLARHMTGRTLAVLVDDDQELPAEPLGVMQVE